MNKEKSQIHRNNEILEDINKSLDRNIEQHQTLYQIIRILLKSSMQRNQADLNFIESFCSKTFSYVNFLKNKLAAQYYNKIFSEITFEKHTELSTIFETGDIGRKMYFILYGKVGILLPLPKQEAKLKLQENTINYQSQEKYDSFEELITLKYSLFRLVNILKEGDYFGEVAIQNKVPRTGTVVAKSDVMLMVLTYQTYQKYIELTQEHINQQKIAFFSNFAVFEKWESYALQLVLRNCEQIQYGPLQYIYKIGDQAKDIYFIEDGEVNLQFFYENLNTQQNQNLIMIKSKPSFKIKNQILLSKFQYFGDWEIFQKNINPSTFSVQLQGLTRKTQVFTQTHFKAYKMSLVQFLEIYRIYSDFSIVKKLQMQKNKIRSNMSFRSPKNLSIQQPQTNEVRKNSTQKRIKTETSNSPRSYLKIFDPDQIKRKKSVFVQKKNIKFFDTRRIKGILFIQIIYLS